MNSNQDVWNNIYRNGGKFGVSRFVVRMGELLPEGSRVLDYGCGKGQNAICLAEKRIHVIGFDISDEAVRKAITAADEAGVAEMVRFFVSDGLNPSIPPEETFDGVVCTYVLDHFPPGLPKPIDRVLFERGLSHVQGFVRPGGYAVVSYATKHIWPKIDEQELREIDREYPVRRLSEFFYGWEVFSTVGQNGDKQTPWGVKNNLDAEILARKPL